MISLVSCVKSAGQYFTFLESRLLKTSLLMVTLSALAGLAGYIFNIIVARLWGAPILGHLLGILGFASVVGLPASFMVLPVARWAAQTASWHRRLPALQLVMLIPGIATDGIIWSYSHNLGDWFHIPTRSWWLPMFAYLVLGYIGLFNIGVLLGRRAYGAMTAATVLPTLGKLGFLGLWLGLGFMGRPIDALWAVVLAGWAGVMLSTLLVYVTAQHVDRSVPRETVWASAWVGAVVNAWLNWDVVLGSVVLSTGNLAIYAAGATVGKVPFHLTSLVANMGVGEEGWGYKRRNNFRNIIIVIGVVSLFIVLFGGYWILGLFRIHSGNMAVIGYLAANTLLALAYYEAGADAQAGRHTWLPLALGLVLWSGMAWLTHPDATVLSLELAAVLLLSYGGIVMKKKVRWFYACYLLRRQLEAMGAAKKGFSNWPQVIISVLLQRLRIIHGELHIVTKKGSHILCPNSVPARAPIFEVFGYDSYRLSELNPDLSEQRMNILDIGAHVGSFTIAMMERFPKSRCICYEPSPKTFEYLRKNIEMNGLQGRVKLRAVAVLAEDRSTDFYEASDASGCNSAIMLPSGTRTRKVKGVAFDNVAVGIDGEIDLLKLDCEGAEYEILFNSKASSWGKIRRVVFEYHPVDDTGWHHLRDYLLQLGFRLQWHVNSDSGFGVAWFARDQA